MATTKLARDRFRKPPGMDYLMRATAPGDYEPFQDKNFIRLINFPNGFSDGKWTVRHYPLNRLPRFAALSYTWQSPRLAPDSIAAYKDVTVDLTLDIDGGIKTLQITKNLDEALRALLAAKQNPELAMHANYIWIDGICINQEDIEERQQQVLLMGEIYSKAQPVLVWLGKDETDLAGFLRVHERIEPVIQKRNSHGADSFNSVWTMFDLDAALDAKLEIEDWQSYVGFYEDQRWFSRVWVAQEVALAGEALVMCGSKTIRWERIQAVKDFIRDGCTLELMELRKVQHGRPAGYEVATMSRLKNFMSRKKLAPEDDRYKLMADFLYDRTGARSIQQLKYALLLECLSTVRSLDSTEAHDKLYSIFGIFTRFTGEEVDERIRPNYSEPVPEIFKEVAWILLRELPKFTILSFVEDASQRRLVEDLPSWAPDWTSTITNNSLLSIMGPDANASLVADDYQGFRDYDENRYSSPLTLKGACFDTITDLADSPQTGDHEDPYEEMKGSIKALESAFDLCLKEPPMTRQPDQTPWDMLWRTLIANRTRGIPNAEITSEEFKHYTTHIYAMHKFRYGIDDLYTRSLLRLEQFQRLSNLKDYPPRDIIDFLAEAREYGMELPDLDFIYTAFSAFAQLAGEITLRRRLFRTKKGHLGIGPLSLKTHDQVWLMDGAHVPFLLRPTLKKGIFTFVGEAYLHGHMKGEMLRGAFGARFSEVKIK